MPALVTAQRYKHRRRRALYFGNILLVAVYNSKLPPYDDARYLDKWHVPGREIRSTDELVKLATIRGLPAVLVEDDDESRRQTRLN